MNDYRDRHTKLLAEAFHDDWSHGAPARFALTAAAHARRRRRLQAVAATLAACSIIAMVALLMVRHRPALPPPVARIIAAKPASPAYEIISDEELISQLRDRPLLVLKTQNGGNHFVLLEN